MSPRRGPLQASALALLLASCGPAPARPVPTDLSDPAVALERLALEPEGEGRRPMFIAIRRAPAERAMPVLRAGLAGPDPALRAAAALAAGRRQDGLSLAPELLSLAASDPETPVRVAATRGLGNLRDPGAFAPLQQNLADPEPLVRLSALRALARIDPDRAAALPDLARLQLDLDRRVADTATKIARGIDPR